MCVFTYAPDFGSGKNSEIHVNNAQNYSVENMKISKLVSHNEFHFVTKCEFMN